MEKELVEKLNEIRKELEIPVYDFIDILAIAEKRRANSIAKISDEVLYEIILSTLMEYDYEPDYENGIYREQKSSEELVDRAMKSLGY